MKNPEMKVIRFSGNDIIVTSTISTIAFTGIGDSTQGNAMVSINGGPYISMTAQQIADAYGIDPTATYVFFKEGDTENMIWSLEQALSTSKILGDSGNYNAPGYTNWNHTFYYYDGKFYRNPKQ